MLEGRRFERRMNGGEHVDLLLVVDDTDLIDMNMRASARTERNGTRTESSRGWSGGRICWVSDVDLAR